LPLDDPARLELDSRSGHQSEPVALARQISEHLPTLCLSTQKPRTSVRSIWEHMFVSEVRRNVAELLKNGLTLNEVAHRLGVARSTVGYHVEVLREQRDEGRARQTQDPKSTGPVAAPEVTRERVRRLLAMGHTRAEAADTLGLSRSTITYHAARLGEKIDSRCGRRYDWTAIRRFHEAGHSVNECQARFGFNKAAWHAAIRRGLIEPRPSRIPLEQLLVAGPRRNRGHLKNRLFAAGLKMRRCESCGLAEWQGQPIPLALHHVNGDRHDNRLANLQILCANCHGLTDTWAGRNNKIRRLRAVPDPPATLPAPSPESAETAA
jgi:DNA-binding NarL/FixJ family response regulator/5-methylcytosine-specific restriction endonuclease McrA